MELWPCELFPCSAGQPESVSLQLSHVKAVVLVREGPGMKLSCFLSSPH